jgi:ubiquinone/menaquinone biosynthesis C-methylase UbiE
MSLEVNLAEMERGREAYWLRHPQMAARKLHWRALTVRHCFQVLPGQSILELGAGSGLWTEWLSRALRHENPITAAVFNEDFANHPRWRSIPRAEPVLVRSLDRFPDAAFDYVVGTAILCHNQYPQTLCALFRVLKPGGEILFFESNFWNPQVLIKSLLRWVGRLSGQASCQVGLRRYRLMQWASEQGFSRIEIVPYDIVHPLLPARLIDAVQSIAFLFEHTPLVKEFCGSLYIRARRPEHGGLQRRRALLAEHPQFRSAVSFVVPCHNEEMNIEPLVDSLTAFYGPYIHQIILVNDNSQDGTAEAVRAAAERDPRVLLINRQPPNGVGRALADGYAAATGRYVFSMDADFVHLLPEFRDLFDALARGADGAIGSRFTNESIMINYSFLKMLGNRCFHRLANLMLPCRVHDISNNLKLFRVEVLAAFQIEEPHFAANAEIGLKSVLAGFRIDEVPVSWIGRTVSMGQSSFHISRVAPGYAHALWRVIRSGKNYAKSPRPSPAVFGKDHHDGA